MLERNVDWDKPRHSVEQLRQEQKSETPPNDREVEPPAERVDDESDDGKILGRQE